MPDYKKLAERVLKKLEEDGPDPQIQAMLEPLTQEQRDIVAIAAQASMIVTFKILNEIATLVEVEHNATG